MRLGASLAFLKLLSPTAERATPHGVALSALVSHCFRGCFWPDGYAEGSAPCPSAPSIAGSTHPLTPLSAPLILSLSPVDDELIKLMNGLDGRLHRVDGERVCRVCFCA